MESGLLLDVVVRQSTSILQLLSSKDQTLLIRRDSFLVLDLGLDIVNGIRGLNIKGDGLACVEKKELETEQVRTMNDEMNRQKQ